MKWYIHKNQILYDNMDIPNLSIEYGYKEWRTKYIIYDNQSLMDRHTTPRPITDCKQIYPSEELQQMYLSKDPETFQLAHDMMLKL